MRVRSFHPIAPDVHSKGAHWSEDALCRGIPEIFFALVKTRRSDPPDWSRAKRICEGCPVKDKCLADGLEADKLGAYGIWGGLDPDERAGLGVGS
jgi:WhiB family redox-sensing transcriptional regulator